MEWKTLFVRNSAKSQLLFIRNTTSASTRNETLDGTDYLVVPCVMIVEGVHNGSQGALFYSKEELAKFTCCWNMKPALLRHPDIEDSGTNVDVLKNQGVGILMNTEFTDGKLKTEIWLNVEKANKLDSRIVERIENNEMIEVSTGLFTELDKTPGVWNEEDYTSNTLNYRPDHLAILLDATGACSVKDGAGLLRNKEKKVDNELSQCQIHDKLMTLVRESSNNDEWAWVNDVYGKYFIYERGEVYYKQDYSISSDDEVSLVGEATEVERIVEYKSVIKNTEAKMLTPEQIAALIANGSYKATDQKFLESLTENQIEILALNFEANTDNDKNEVAPVKKEIPAGSQIVANTVAEKEVTVASFLEDAPESIRAVINQGLATYESAKKTAIVTILANKSNVFTEAALNEKDVPTLEGIAKLASIPVVESVDNSIIDIPVLDTIYAPQPDASKITNEDVPTLNTIEMFPKED